MSRALTAKPAGWRNISETSGSNDKAAFNRESARTTEENNRSCNRKNSQTPFSAFSDSLWFAARRIVTGNPTFDGTLSVIFALYIRHAGNAIDLLFYDRGSFRFAQWNSLRWLALNILTLFMGWLVIYLGTTHLTSRAD